MNAPARTPDIDVLMSLWHDAGTERERAEIEGELWNVAPRDERKAFKGATRWLNALLGASQRSFEARLALRLAQPDSEPIWARIDGDEKMLLETASQILSRARIRTIADNILRPEAIQRELAEYDSWPLVRAPDGKTFRKRPARVRRGMGNGQGHRTTSSKDHWPGVRAAIWRLVDHELAGVPEHERTQLRNQVEVEVRTMMDLIGNRIRQAKKNVTLNGTPVPIAHDDSRAKLREACELLSVDPPKRSKPIDHVTYMKAKGNFRKLVREYHPTNSGTDSTRDRYQAVVEAMGLIQTNYEQSNTTAHEAGDRHHDHGNEHE